VKPPGAAVIRAKNDIVKNLFGLSRERIEAELVALGHPAFRGRQIYRWMYARGAADFEAMTDLSRGLRADLSRVFTIALPSIAERHVSRDGTIKYLLELADGRNVETVYIPDGERHTFCLSTQVGCPLKCTFCFSGTIRFERNLEPGEILAQFVLARGDLPVPPARTNVVFMGMGEPLLNTEGVLAALEVLTDDDALAVSPRRITVSTAGVVDQLEAFSAKAPTIGLAISLHATTNERRDQLMPINRKYPIREVIEAARRLPLPRRRRITFEYVLLGGDNDTLEDAHRLASLLEGVKAKVNVIAYNPWPGAPHKRSTPEASSNFIEVLAAAGLTASLRRSRGADVLAACGQLANKSG
jgi:23S rRNA (adenine2503-C2)-methyltransferase